MSHDLFISYSSNDKPIADAVCATLEARGIRCWIAPRDILPGTDYGEAIVDAIAEGQFMVLILSTSANQSRQVIREVERAVSKGVIIIPFRVEQVALSKSLEYFLSTPHWLDALTPPLEKHIEYLAETVRLLKSQQASDKARVLDPPGAIVQPSNAPQAAPSNNAQLDAGLTFETYIHEPGKLVGQRFGSYVLLAPIGKGGSGIVYRALNPKLGLEVCVKVFYPLTQDVERVAHVIERGVRGVAALNHPNIVKIHDFATFTLAGRSSFYLVMELVSGTTLTDWIDGRTTVELFTMALGIAQALEAAHQAIYFDEAGFQQRGLLHGDIKPGNIMVRPDNSPVLLDFMMVDVQRLLDQNIVPFSDMGPITAVCGTPNYMSPEQRERGIVTVKTDIYSLGATFLELFIQTRRLLDPGDHEDVNPESDDAIKGMWRLIRTMVSPDPGARPSDMSEVVKEIAVLARKAEMKSSRT